MTGAGEGRCEAIADRIRDRVSEICATVPPIDPPAQFWLDSDAGPSYCRECSIIARGHEFELGPLLARSDWHKRDEWEDAFFDGIDGGFDIESEHAECCYICGRTLSYILTDYGEQQEADYWLESPIVQIRDEDSYALDRLALNVFAGMQRSRLLSIAAVVNQTYRLFKRGEFTPATGGGDV